LCIISAFSALVAERSYEEVTVEMIIRRAEVSKTTFYRYFCEYYGSDALEAVWES